MLLLGKTMEEMEAAPDEHMRYSLTADENGFAVAEVRAGRRLSLLPSGTWQLPGVASHDAGH